MERQIYEFCKLVGQEINSGSWVTWISLAHFVYFFEFLNDKIHNYVFLTFRHEISQPRSSTCHKWLSFAQFVYILREVCFWHVEDLSCVNVKKKSTKLERTFRPHYRYQNFSQLANGTDLNREKYAILQTHWH